MRWALTIDYNPVREKLMIKKVGVVDKPEAIIRYKKINTKIGLPYYIK